MRASLVRDWQQRLEECQREEGCAPSRMRWLFRARRRLYRFLLSLYGDGSWRSDDARREEQSAATTDATENVLTVPLEGKPPKGIAEIRKTLKSVGQANTSPPSGELSREDVEQGTIIVASGRRRKEVDRITFALAHTRYPWRVMWRSGQWSIITHYRDLAEVRDIIERVRRQPIEVKVVSQPFMPSPHNRLLLLFACLAALLPVVVILNLPWAYWVSEQSSGLDLLLFTGWILSSLAIFAFLRYLLGPDPKIPPEPPSDDC